MAIEREEFNVPLDTVALVLTRKVATVERKDATDHRNLDTDVKQCLKQLD